MAQPTNPFPLPVNNPWYLPYDTLDFSEHPDPWLLPSNLTTDTYLSTGYGFPAQAGTPILDSDGNPILDSDGNPILSTV